MASSPHLSAFREQAFPICRRVPGGALVRGPTARGTRDNVNVPSCPPGHETVGSWHTHPPGDVAFPSDLDVETHVANGWTIACVEAPDRQQRRCYHIRAIGG